MWPDEQIVFQYFAIDSNENLPENLQIEPKCAKNFDQNQNGKSDFNFSKFQKIWTRNEKPYLKRLKTYKLDTLVLFCVN